MAFRIPQFNISVSIFTHGTYGFSPARLIVNGQLRSGEHVVSGVGAAGPATWFPMMALLLPHTTDIRDGNNAPVGAYDQVECPTGTGRVYDVIIVDDVARGFPNEYRLASLYKSTHIWPTPTP